MRGRTSPETSLSSTQEWAVAKAIFEEHGIFTSRVTHGGRHSGSIEANNLGISIEDIKRGGGWQDDLSRLETHYMGRLPGQFARGMAGFREKPFHLSRNIIKPPLDLQRQIFPWIEGMFPQEKDAWKVECDQEMNEYDENYGDDDDDVDLTIEIVEEDGIVRPISSTRKTRRLLTGYDLALRGFLNLLLRCRRIILQDAAVFLSMNRTNRLVDNDVFKSPAFKAFQEDVAAALDDTEYTRLQEFEGLVPNIVDSQKEVAAHLSQINNQMLRDTQSINSQFASLQGFIDQQDIAHRHHDSLLTTITYQLQQLANSHQTLMSNQQFLTAQMQLLASNSNTAPPPSAFAPSASVARPLSASAFAPSTSAFTPSTSAFAPSTTAFAPSTSAALLPSPILIRPASPLVSVAGRRSQPRKNKGKGKDPFVFYQPNE